MSNQEFNVSYTPHYSRRVRHFHSAEELVEWTEKELQGFDFFLSKERLPHGASAVQQHMKSSLNAIKNIASRFLEADEPEEQQQARQQIVQALQKLGAGGIGYVSTDPETAMLRIMGEEDSQRMLLTLDAIGLPKNTARTGDMLVALAEWQARSATLALGDLDAYREGLEQRSRSLIERLESALPSVEQNFQNHLSQLNEEFDVTFQALRDQAGMLLDEARQTREKIEADHKELVDFYEQQTALQAPSRYWSAKVKSHRRRSCVSAVALAIWLAAATIGLTVYGNVILGPALRGDMADRVIFVHFAIFIVLAVLVLWPARLGAKYLSSNLHLLSDAEERVVMTKVYLSLLKRKAGPNENEKLLIVESLFRPSQTGIVKDEGIGHPSIDALTRILFSR